MTNKVKDILNINNDYNELSERCEEVDIKTDIKSVRETISFLKKTMENKNLEYLSAPAIGIKQRVFCIKTQTEIKTFINPLITSREGLTFTAEFNLTDPDKYYLRVRNSEIMLAYMRPTGQAQSTKLIGKIAQIAQQMIDDLDGIQDYDIGMEIPSNFNELPDEQRLEIINDYIEQLDLLAKDFTESVREDEQGNKMLEAIRFINSVHDGTTILDDDGD